MLKEDSVIKSSDEKVLDGVRCNQISRLAWVGLDKYNI